MTKNNRDKVAELAGVSSATVSRVYNNPDKVSRTRKKAVLDAARTLGYSPDKSASALRRKGTGQITLVSIRKKKRTPYWGDFPTAKWFFTDVLNGIMDVVEDSMYRLNLKTLHSADEIASINWQQECDGAIFYDVVEQEEATAIASSCSVPSVISHNTSDFTECNRCSTNNYQGGVIAGRHLLEKGYIKPVYISYLPEVIRSNKQRFEGFQQAFSQIEVPHILGEPGKKGGYDATKSLMGQIRSGSIDAIAVVNDLTAIGVIHCLQEEGLKPGRDIGLIAYDNMPLNYVLPFNLSSVDLRPAFLYREATSMLLDCMRSDRESDQIISRTVMPELVEGDSV